MSDKKVTAVQWFEQKLDDLDIEIPFWVFNEALEMESEKNQKFDEMLEMLKMLLKYTDSIGLFKQIEQLIKEATEL
jgi:hypothetical protein